MQPSEATFLKQLSKFGPQFVNTNFGQAGQRIASLAQSDLVTMDHSVGMANPILVTITDAGRAALSEHLEAEKAARERLAAALAAPKPAQQPAPAAQKRARRKRSASVSEPPPAPSPADVTAQVMAESGYEPGSEPGQYHTPRRERPSVPGGIAGAPRIAEEAAFDAALIEFARAARRRGLDVETDGEMDRYKVACAANQVLRGVASDRPPMTTERLCEALGNLVETPATEEERKAA